MSKGKLGAYGTAHRRLRGWTRMPEGLLMQGPSSPEWVAALMVPNCVSAYGRLLREQCPGSEGAILAWGPRIPASPFASELTAYMLTHYSLSLRNERVSTSVQYV
ncbi:hypothetical protein CGRA01v4_03449 [Colletotrichum graminicola]|nr:hypothetical protein CGRA01v4_03449 [Colletotrichum graminicola]